MLDGHKRTSIGDLCDFINGNGFRPSDWRQSGLPIIRIQNLNGSTSFNYFEGVPKERWVVEPGDLLFAWAGVKGVSFGPALWPGPRGVLNQHIFRVVPKPGVDKYWLYLALQVATGRIEANAHGFKSSLVHVQKDDITNQVVDCPSLSEQRKIAEIVGRWDNALDKLKTLRASRTARFLGLSQALLSHAGVFPDKWPMRPLSEISTRIRRQNSGGDHPVMTISARSGFLKQSDKFARDMAGSSVDRYTLLQEGEFAYNKGNSLSAPYGCIYRLDRQTALVPFVYFCFALKPGLEPTFYEHLFAAGALNRQLSRLINSGVRNDGLLNLNVEDFFSCKIPVPPAEEQRRIALALSAAKDELALLDQEIEALTRQKRGLMQKLLTGELSVHIMENIG
ncbi:MULTISPECIES: restriction endonuclease subunit S [Pseudomonas]|uniref:restriction endonuclease subunit S n=1 Tax=Pseudomonas TaxID=286 RepID=UPI0018AA23A9|nr:restriction endonuclease subunit S [Pseudomonas putida]MBF8710008.1 restriction endonuclease subunit S [Pseudomonas putida]